MAPHATDDGNMATNGVPLTNGDVPTSRVLSHLNSYPVVHDSVETFKTHPYGERALTLASNTYNNVVAPLHPYLRTPYSYISPYLARADQLGDSGLSTLESHLPIVKEDTQKLKQYAYSPVNYVHGAWQDEYNKTHYNNGVLKMGVAAVSFELRMISDACDVVLAYLNKGKEQAKKKAEEVKQ
ncbi:hypothetical protein GGP41_008194 [Bipolaris sorokiniana]|uniref:CAP20-virulence factor n=2 Tax=Cochliobolus sativus TaxID=45130 RepID=A0A8H5ZPH3_COCSA|nr:uncharacterized protein COCSADRAFT_302585 [Bipolaris sorokiniana ND90Pr]EMD66806.1 hypothetical protein COCSADRAFT_302585 [Bipolaris sorokiniana ND90Pr]KAF5852790.1 hypothetical protein GGP41_008194 [Bipolaris sorokiniana]